MPKVLQTLQKFLDALKGTHNDPTLLARWTPSMETQINVAAGSGEPVEGKRNTYTDGSQEWWNIRIPKHANTEPEFRDYDLKWSLAEHADAIGCTGWDWVAKTSRWVGFDFDSITGHAAGVGVTDEELDRVRAAASALPWVEVRRSTGGSGLHLYVYFDAAGVGTSNHTEHAALGRAILGLMASETGFDFASQIDVCGGNMWIWHRKMTEANRGLALIKAAERNLGGTDLPSNWRDHIEVVQRRRAKVRVGGVEDAHLDPFEALASSRRVVPLDESHKAVLDALRNSGFTSVWVPDHHLLQTHTRALQNLQDDADMRIAGFFKTKSEGRDPGTANCFLFPLDNGGWKVYRFGPGIAEAETWEQDGDGWTTCYFNRAPTIKIACRAMGGIEDAEKGGFVFDSAEQALKAAKALGQKNVPIPDDMLGRETRLKAHKDGRLVMLIAKQSDDSGMKKNGWLAKKDYWVQVFNTRIESSRTSELDQTNYDTYVRVLVSPNSDLAGYRIKDKEGSWNRASREVAKGALIRLGMAKPEAEVVLASVEHEPWKLVNVPFQPEFPGNRMWNYGAAQFSYQPAESSEDNPHPHWDRILRHCGQDLDLALRDLDWAQKANIRTGGDYLLHWAACMFREPYERLPFLFFYGDQNSGKSIYWEALELLMTAGVVSADRALTNQGDFNGEIANGVLAVIEEKNMAISPGAYNRLKDWTTNHTLWIRRMRTDTYAQANTLHFVQTANERENCTIKPGDTRITMFYVPMLQPGDEIPKPILKDRLREEAPYFMRTVMDLQLPPMMGRLRLPMVTNSTKARAEEASRNPLESFIAECCHYVIGELVPIKDFYARFIDWLDEADYDSSAKSQWASKSRIVKELPHRFPYGTGTDNKRLIGNIAFDNKPPKPDACEWIEKHGRLTKKKVESE